MKIDVSLYRKEWDADAFNRKWINTWAICADAETKEISTKYIVAWLGWHGSHPAITVLDPITKLSVNTNKLLPLYVRIPNGWYESKDGHVCVWRKLGKTFHIGVNTETHYGIWGPDNLNKKSFPLPPFHLETYPCLHKLDINVEKAIETFGPLSRDVYLSKDTVFYHHHEIGLRKKDKIMVNDWITQEIVDVIKGTKCQLILNPQQ